jgi:Leucine-rich repeat (LRR) protein
MRLLNYSISIMKNLVFHLFGSISYVSGNPVDNIAPLANSYSLKNLNIENTPVSDLTPIALLKNIKVLNIGGTSV